MKIQKIWDKYWSGREALNTESVATSDPYYRLLRRLIDLSKGEKLNIMEAGCGSGVRTLALVREFQEHPLNAMFIDYSPTALAFARKNALKNRTIASFVLADVLNLPFPNETLDVVWNEGVNEHFNGPKRSLIFREMTRVCKKGGQVIVIVPNALNLPYRLRKRLLELQGRWEYGFEKAFSIFELRNKMKSAGVISNKAGGVTILSSFFPLLELISKKALLSRPPNAKQIARLGILRRTFWKIEGTLERLLGAVVGENIGIRAIKNRYEIINSVR